MKKILFNKKFLAATLVFMLMGLFGEAAFMFAPVETKLISMIDIDDFVTEETDPGEEPKAEKKNASVTLFGQASYYADMFHGRKTANGETFKQNGLTAACNSLPLGTWIKVTNLANGKNVIVKTNDRLHARMKRVVDLSKAAAVKLGYTKQGLARVKIEVLDKNQL